MKSFIRSILVIFFMAGATSAFAAPTSSSFAPRISIALPAAQFDFSDLDVRDEFNRPVVSSVVRQRFEEALTRELNRLLLDNLTPLRRAWLDLLDKASGMSGDWLSAAASRVETLVFAVLRANFLFSLFITDHAMTSDASTDRTAGAGDDEKFSLTLLTLSSTRLLR